MDVHSLRFRYTLTFFAIAIFYILSLLFCFSLINQTESGMSLFSQKFNPSISAVLNGDRDLYQARVAELNILIDPSDASQRKAFDENAQQTFDRMQKYKNKLTDFPDINDLLVWLGSEEKINAASTVAFRTRLPFYKHKREYFTDQVVGGAFSFFSPLSIQYLLDNMVPELSEIAKRPYNSPP